MYVCVCTSPYRVDISAAAIAHTHAQTQPGTPGSQLFQVADVGFTRSEGTGHCKRGRDCLKIFFFSPPIKQFPPSPPKLTFAPPILVAPYDPSLPAAAFKFIYLPAGVVYFSFLLLLLLRRKKGSSCWARPRRTGVVFPISLRSHLRGGFVFSLTPSLLFSALSNCFVLPQKLMFPGLDPALSQRGSRRLKQISAPRCIAPFVP